MPQTKDGGGNGYSEDERRFILTGIKDLWEQFKKTFGKGTSLAAFVAACLRFVIADAKNNRKQPRGGNSQQGVNRRSHRCQFVN